MRWKCKWQEFLHFAYFDATNNLGDNKLLVTACHWNPSHSCWVPAAARLLEGAGDNAHKTFCLDSLTCLITGHCSNHRYGGKKEMKERIILITLKFCFHYGLLFATWSFPALLRQQQTRETDPRSHWAITVIESPVQDLCNTFQCSLAPLLHWKLPSEYTRFEHMKNYFI